MHNFDVASTIYGSARFTCVTTRRISMDLSIVTNANICLENILLVHVGTWAYIQQFILYLKHSLSSSVFSNRVPSQIIIYNIKYIYYVIKVYISRFEVFFDIMYSSIPSKYEETIYGTQRSSCDYEIVDLCEWSTHNRKENSRRMCELKIVSHR
jgi:hypothetical protein